MDSVRGFAASRSGAILHAQRRNATSSVDRTGQIVAFSRCFGQFVRLRRDGWWLSALAAPERYRFLAPALGLTERQACAKSATVVSRERRWERRRAPGKKEIASSGNVKSGKMTVWGITQVRHARQIEEVAKSADQGRR